MENPIQDRGKRPGGQLLSRVREQLIQKGRKEEGLQGRGRRNRCRLPNVFYYLEWILLIFGVFKSNQ